MKYEEKEKNFKAREKWLLAYKKFLIRLKADIFIETMVARKQWNDIISAVKKKNQQKSLFLQLYKDTIEI